MAQAPLVAWLRMFVNEVVEEGLQRAVRSDLYPVTAGEDIFATIRGVNAEVDLVLKHDVPQPPPSLDTAAPIHSALRSQEFVETVRALDRLVDVALGEMHRAKRDDVVKLLDDPLSSETRNTRRNLGVLTVLAVLIGLAGKAPDSFLGLGMTSFPKWAFPLLLLVVIIYEFLAFTLYLNADLERRKIHSLAARHDRDVLRVALDDFNKREAELAKFMSSAEATELLTGMGKVEEAGSVVAKCAKLAAHWKQDVEQFEREFGIQWRRRWWDEYMPFALLVVANFALFTVLPPIRLWLWELCNR